MQLLLAALLVPLAGCFPLTVDSKRDPAADFASLHTYAWLAKKKAAPQDPRVDNDIVDAKVRDTTNAVLREKGYALAADGVRPDFMIAFRITTQDIPGDDKIPDYWGYYPVWQGGLGFYTSPVEEGTLVIDVIDTSSMHLVWRGTAERQMVEVDSPEDRIARLEKSVRKLMERFPS